MEKKDRIAPYWIIDEFRQDTKYEENKDVKKMSFVQVKDTLLELRLVDWMYTIAT